jgi:cellulose biosynthesis protein BcsQ
VIHPTDSYHIDVIGNDAVFCDQFMNNAGKLTALSYLNHELIKETLEEIRDDYDICIMDCSPGRFLLHDNIFHTSDLLLIPNVPAPLSVYCNNMLMDSLPAKTRTLSFYNMVQAHKNLHKFYLERRLEDAERILYNYVPFYAEIESITMSRESIFHQLKEFKTNIYYVRLWEEICERMQWKELDYSKGVIRNIDSTSQTHVNIPRPHPLYSPVSHTAGR